MENCCAGAENSAPYVIVVVAFGGDTLWRDLGDGDVIPEDCIICSSDGLDGESSTTCLDISIELVPFVDENGESSAGCSVQKGFRKYLRW